MDKNVFVIPGIQGTGLFTPACIHFAYLTLGTHDDVRTR